ncbi:hypothetical protein [Paenibacillus kobensis]|uniref:hypothetical protein n=1 Tax=Paenibacillus kobensis TaxID=59841 RepID=UPI000FD7C1BE|nr:hypothetical protein [Paenibacillus kobensis]
MAIQFLDERISVHRNNSTGAEVLSATPLLIGDIGLQTGAAVPAGNASLVRVALTGTVGVGVVEEVAPTVTLTIERNSNGTAGTGVVILTDTFNIGFSSSLPPFSVSGGDFPPAAAVTAGAGEIRYSLFLSVDTTGVVLTGPAVFNGSASAGTT